MPIVAIRAGKGYELGGVAFTLVITRGKDLAYLAVAGETDGLIDGHEEVLAEAEKRRSEMESPARNRIDKTALSVKDEGNSCPPQQASG